MASARSRPTTLGKQAKTDLPADRVRRGLPRVASSTRRRAPTSPRAAGARRRRLGRGEVSMTTAQGLAAEGHRPRPRRRAQRPPPPRRWRRLRPEAALAHLQGQPQGPPPGAALGVLGPRRPRQHRRARRRGLRGAVDQAGRRGARQVGPEGRRRWSLCDPEEAGVREELSQHPQGRRAPGRLGRRRRRDRPRLADRHPSARSRRSRLAVGEVERAPRRRRGEQHGRAPGDHRAGRLGEELRADGRRQVHVPRRRPRPQDADPPRGRGDLRASAWSRCARSRCARSRSAAACTAARTRSWKKAIVQLAPGDRIELFEGAAVAE